VTQSLLPYGRLAHSDDSDLPRDAIHHIPSPLEPSAIDRLWPPALRSQPLVVTLHDLIPAVFPDECMPDPGVRRAYWARTELIRQADRVLSVSHATASDAVRLLGVRQAKLSVTGGGVSESFRPPASRDKARDALRRLRSSIDAEFLLYTGGMDYRKNIDALLQAYAGLPSELRDRHKLVLAGRLGLSDPRGPFASQAEALGVSDRVVFTGYVSDEELVLLYQAASLFVFPSLYEGFGLPVVEALACGAPAIVGRTSSLVELVNEEALFDPADPSSIQAALVRALTDAELLERLRRPDIRHQFTWRKIAELTANAYEETAPRRRPARSRKRILCVAPLPAAGADGETTRRVLAALAGRFDVDLLVEDRDGQKPPAGVEPVSAAGLARGERLRNGYDETVYWLGNALDYAFPLHVLRGRPGIVVAYNVRLTSLYAAAASNRPDLEPRPFLDAVRSFYGGRLPAELADADALDDAAADRHGIYMAGEAIASSKRFFVHFPAAVTVARLEARPGDEQKIDWLPLPVPQAEPAASPETRRSFAVFTGAGPSPEGERVVTQLRELGAEVTMANGTHSVASGYAAGIAVGGAQNAPGFATFVADCLAAGVPLLLVGLSLGDHLPDSVGELAEATDTELRTALRELHQQDRPVSPAEAVASVEEVVERLDRAMQDLNISRSS
jgi:glycosyltransferase involved in cell wall biosynthesis